MTYILAMQEAKTTKPEAVREAIAAANFETLYGRIKFTPQGDGDAVLLEILAVREDTENAAQRDAALGREYAQQIASAEAEGYAAAARADAKVALNPQAID